MRLDDVAVVQTGIAKGKPTTNSDGVALPYLRVANVQDGYVDLSEMKEIVVEAGAVERYRLRAGDVLFTEGGDFDKLGRGCVWRGQVDPCLHQNHVFAVRVRPEILIPEFLAMYAASPRGKAYFLSCSKQTTNLASINSTQLRLLPLALPPLPEQRKIAAILSSVDDAIGKTQAVIDQLGVVKKAMMQELLTKGLPGRHARFKQTEIGMVPEDWEVVPLRELVLSGPTNGKSPPSRATPPGTPTFSIAAVRQGRVRIFENLKYTDVEEADVQRYAVAPGDILIVRGNANPDLIGKCGVVEAAPPRCIYPDILMRVRPSERIEGSLLVTLWNADVVHDQPRRRTAPTRSTRTMWRPRLCLFRSPSSSEPWSACSMGLAQPLRGMRPISKP